MALLMDQNLVLELDKSQVFEDLHYLVHHNILLDLLHLMMYQLDMLLGQFHNIHQDLLHLMRNLQSLLFVVVQYMFTACSCVNHVKIHVS